MSFLYYCTCFSFYVLISVKVISAESAYFFHQSEQVLLFYSMAPSRLFLFCLFPTIRVEKPFMLYCFSFWLLLTCFSPTDLLLLTFWLDRLFRARLNSSVVTHKSYWPVTRFQERLIIARWREGDRKNRFY